MRNSLKFYRLSGAIFYDCINIIYQFTCIKPFLDNKMSIFEEYGAFIVILFSYLIQNIHMPMFFVVIFFTTLLTLLFYII